jgi:hypothetical protein
LRIERRGFKSRDLALATEEENGLLNCHGTFKKRADCDVRSFRLCTVGLPNWDTNAWVRTIAAKVIWMH